MAVAAAYHPALHGTPVWDDAAHLTHPALRSLRGLWRIWTDLGATQQYYPLTHTAFWIQHRLWGDAVLGHHVVNVALHAGSAFLLALLLRRTRAPFAVLALFVVGLFPALGFVDVFPFRYSFVADHFQYLASIPVLAALITLAVRRLTPAGGARAGARAAAILLVALPLAALEADARMVQAHNDLGAVLQMQGDVEGAIGQYEAAIALRPDYADAHFNLGNALFQAGRLDAAVERYRTAARLSPADALVRNNLGMALLALGRNAEAAAEFAATVELEPGFEEARRNLARAAAGSRP